MQGLNLIEFCAVARTLAADVCTIRLADVHLKRQHDMVGGNFQWARAAADIGTAANRMQCSEREDDGMRRENRNDFFLVLCFPFLVHFTKEFVKIRENTRPPEQ
jgi:hypothetical protein